MADRDSRSRSRPAVTVFIVKHPSLGARSRKGFDVEDLIVDEVADTDNPSVHRGSIARFPSSARTRQPDGHLVQASAVTDYGVVLPNERELQPKSELYFTATRLQPGTCECKITRLVLHSRL